MDMKCMSHSTKNRMKPNTARPCMARSSRAMAVSGSCLGGGPAGVTRARDGDDQMSGHGRQGESGCFRDFDVFRLTVALPDHSGGCQVAARERSSDNMARAGFGPVTVVSQYQCRLGGFDSQQTDSWSADRNSGGLGDKNCYQTSGTISK